MQELSDRENTFTAQFPILDKYKNLVRVLEDMQIQSPTPIQAQSIAKILSGKDLIGISETGSGKTLAYLLPILIRLHQFKTKDPPALVLLPTKELTLQIFETAQKLTKYTNIHPLCILRTFEKQIMDVAQNQTQLIIGTPQSVLFFYQKQIFNLRKIKILVLDEADMLLERGFKKQFTDFLEVLNPKRQNLLFSATFPSKVENFCKEFLLNPEKVMINKWQKIPSTITQSVYFVPNIATKNNILKGLLKGLETHERVIVFTQSKSDAQSIETHLAQHHISVRTLHSNKSQNTRSKAIEELKLGKINTLVATDVASRGLDISGITHIIHWDIPSRLTNYLHRTGRTGRMGKTGVSIALCHPAEKYDLKRIQNVIGMGLKICTTPNDCVCESTPYEEQQNINRRLDFQRQKQDPTYKGAFHRKKRKS